MIRKLLCWLGKLLKKPKTVLAKPEFGGEWFRFKVHKGNQIYLDWFGYPFPVELQEDGSTICKEEKVVGYNKRYHWRWIEDDGRNCRNALF